MANPAAPTESGGNKLAFMLGDDQAAGNEAVLRARFEDDVRDLARL